MEKAGPMKISRDIIAVGVLGENDLESIQDLIFGLPANFPASVLVILQIPAEVSRIEQILIKKASMPFIWACEGQDIQRGRVYLGSSHACLVTRPWGVLGLEPAMANDHHHLAIKRFFDSAAHVWGNRVIGVLLNSKNASQATVDLASIKLGGGIAVVGDRDNTFSSSLCTEVDEDESHRLLPSTHIANLLVRLIEMPAPKITTNMSFRMRNQKIYDC
jgi:two-component system chemotaxis response regulator CheB